MTVAATACRSAPRSYGWPAGLSDQLVARFPTSFGGLVNTDCLTRAGPSHYRHYVVGVPTRIQAYVHPDPVSSYSRYWYVMRAAAFVQRGTCANERGRDRTRSTHQGGRTRSRDRYPYRHRRTTCDGLPLPRYSRRPKAASTTLRDRDHDRHQRDRARSSAYAYASEAVSIYR